MQASTIPGNLQKVYIMFGHMYQQRVSVIMLANLEVHLADLQSIRLDCVTMETSRFLLQGTHSLPEYEARADTGRTEHLFRLP
jgi:hypothetical protein